MGCGTLLRSALTNCDTPFQGGIGRDSNLVLLERDSIATITKNTEGAITALTLVPGASAFQFNGFKNSLKPGSKKVDAPSGQPMYQHMAEYSVFDYSQSQKNNLKRKSFGRYVAFYFNSLQDVNSCEVMGLGAGLQLKELERKPLDNGGAWKVILETAENEFEADLPVTVTGADYASIVTLVNNLVFIPTITTIAPAAAAAAGGTALTLTCTNLFGGGTNNAVARLEWVNQLTGAIVNQAVYVVVSNTSITCNSPAMAAGVYKARVTTIKGVSELSVQNLIVT